jgi:hypothetical protein
LDGATVLSVLRCNPALFSQSSFDVTKPSDEEALLIARGQALAKLLYPFITYNQVTGRFDLVYQVQMTA